MVEKKQIVYDLRLNYNGPLSIEELYADIEKWAEERGLFKDFKKKSEGLLKKGKTVEWRSEFWKAFSDSHKEVVAVVILFNNVRERKLKRGNKVIKMNYADVQMTIDGWLETSLTGRWTQAPLYTFFRTLYDKYIWMVIDKYDGPVTDDCYDLHKRLKTFLNLYKMKVA